MTNLRGQSGFTLIEVLVVVVIIGVLAAIAIPQFTGHRGRAFEATLKADLRNAAVAEEAYYAQNQVYKTGALSASTLPGYNKTQEINMTAVAGTTTFTLAAAHSNCTGTWSYDSTTGLPTGPAC
jgi:prepilin-type N-terminal cleavage/methylation domain-containing protein